MNFKQNIIAHTFRNKYLKYTGNNYSSSNSSSSSSIADNKIAKWFYEDEEGNLHSKLNFVGDLNVSAYGVAEEGDTGSITIDVIDNLLSDRTDAALSANQGKVLNEKIENIIEQGVGTSSWNDLEDKPVLLTDENIQKWNTQTHTHSNKSVLDGLSSTKIENWDAAYTHISDGIRHITNDERNNWNKALEQSHTHTNKTVLDGITSTKVSNWDSVYKDFNDVFEIEGDILKVKLNLVGEKQVSAYGFSDDAGSTTTVDVIDNLLSTRTDAALSANQGRILKDLIDTKSSITSWNDLTDKPSVFPPSTHTHNYASTVKVGSTSYTVSDNTISLPAYPTIPSSVKNPYALTISLNGTSQGAYDGSAAKSINITAASVGAATSSHTHTKSQITDFPTSWAWGNITGKPTTLSGYGITDGVNAVSVTGSGNAITAASVAGHTLTLTKGSTFLLSSQYTAADILAKLKTVDGNGSGLDADLLDGYHITNYQTGGWYDLPTYAYDSTNGMRCYWTKIANLNKTQECSILELEAKGDYNYPTGFRSYLYLSCYNGSSYNVGIINMPHIDSGARMKVVLDTNKDVWVKAENVAWSCFFRFRILRASQITIYTGNFTKQEIQPSNSSNSITTGGIKLYNNSFVYYNSYLDTIVSHATKLQTSRNINGTPFDGTQDITTASWGTSRNINIASSDDSGAGGNVAVNGSANVTLKLPETIKATVQGNSSSASKLTTSAGSATRPVYFANGIPVAGTYTFGNSSGNAAINNGTVCTNLNADMLDGLSWSNFDIRQKYTINLSGYSTSNFYPVIFTPDYRELDCWIQSPSAGGADSYNCNRVHFLLSKVGWSDFGKTFTMLSRHNYSDSEITIGSIGCGDENGCIAVWLRGGKSYTFRCTRVPSLKTSTYTNGNEVYTVGTGLSGGTNSRVTIIWQNNDDRDKYDLATISSNVASATKLQTARTIWGQSFDGTENISGNMTGVGSITASGNITADGAITAKTASDMHLKNIVKCQKSYQQRLLELGKVVDFTYNTVALDRNRNAVDENIHTGLIYQTALKANISNFTFKDSDGYGSINYLSTDYINLIAGALQETIIENQKLRTEINRLKSQIL